MNRISLINQIKEKRSYLCVGLDVDIEKIPKKFLKFDNPILAFNKTVIEISSPYCVAYKPNTAFYERLGKSGWSTLEETFQLFPKNILSIADAKRGDIGNTSGYYADAFFHQLNADAVTIAPYMGSDSVLPFLLHSNKWAIVLAITSNLGSADFQQLKLEDGRFLFEEVVSKCMAWGSPDSMMFVVGATQTDYLKKMRSIAPEHFFLVPGVGAQGGSLLDVSEQAMTNNCGLLVNSSRAILYPKDLDNFEIAVENACIEMQQEMEAILQKKGVI